MQPEDILRLRDNLLQNQKQAQLEQQQGQLLNQLKQTIRVKTVVPTERFNNILEQVIKLIKNS